MKKKRGILFGVVFICVLFFVIVFFVRNKESAEPVSKSDFKLNTVVTVTIYDLEEKEKKPDDKDKRNEKGIHREEKDAEEIIDKALKLCDKYEKIFSRTLPESEIYALNHGTLPMEDGYYLLSEECAALNFPVERLILRSNLFLLYGILLQGKRSCRMQRQSRKSRHV